MMEETGVAWQRVKKLMEGGNRCGGHRTRTAARVFAILFTNTTLFLSHVDARLHLFRGIRAKMLLRDPKEPVSLSRQRY